MKNFLFPIRSLFVLTFTSMFFALVGAHAAIWRSISTDDDKAAASKIDPAAGAEILFRERNIDCSKESDGTANEYVRIKVYNEDGVRLVSKIEITCDGWEKLSSISARVTKPDGSIADACQFDKPAKKTLTLSFPHLAPGDIVDYQWEKRLVDYGMANGFKLEFQRFLPTRRVAYYVKLRPIQVIIEPRTRTLSYSFHCPNIRQLSLSSNDMANIVKLNDLPALAKEPYMPPLDDVQAWMVIYLGSQISRDEKNFWSNRGVEIASIFENCVQNPSRLVRETAVSVAAGAATPREKMARLNDYCRTIGNKSLFPSLSRPIRETTLFDSIPSTLPSLDVIISGKSKTLRGKTALLIAMARSLGIDARLALCSDWNCGAFRKQLLLPSYYINAYMVAVKFDDAWYFYDPTDPRVPAGIMRWNYEGNTALICTRKAVEWAAVPVTPAEKSFAKRAATLKLDADGTLSGDIAIEYNGQRELAARMDYTRQTPQKISGMVEEKLRAIIPNAEIENARVDNLDDITKPPVLSYHVRIPGYAGRPAANRLSLQPGFFSKGESPKFTAETREYNIFFNYPFAEADKVTIALPKGYELEDPVAPESATEFKWGYYKTKLSYNKANNELLYTRVFVFRQHLLPVEQYKAIKDIFDKVYQQDSRAVTLYATGQ